MCERHILTRHALRNDEHALIGAGTARMLAAHHFGYGRVDPAWRFGAKQFRELFPKLLATVDDEEIGFFREIASRLGTVKRRDHGARCDPFLLEHGAAAVRCRQNEIGLANSLLDTVDWPCRDAVLRF